MIAETAAELARLGPANFLYSDGDTLFVHAHKRHWDEGGGRFSEARPPGLSYASRNDLVVKGLHATPAEDDCDAIFVASVPLTESGWTGLPESSLSALCRGRLIAETSTGQ